MMYKIGKRKTMALFVKRGWVGTKYLSLSPSVPPFFSVSVAVVILLNLSLYSPCVANDAKESSVHCLLAVEQENGCWAKVLRGIQLTLNIFLS